MLVLVASAARCGRGVRQVTPFGDEMGVFKFHNSTSDDEPDWWVRGCLSIGKNAQSSLGLLLLELMRWGMFVLSQTNKTDGTGGYSVRE